MLRKFLRNSGTGIKHDETNVLGPRFWISIYPRSSSVDGQTTSGDDSGQGPSVIKKHCNGRLDGKKDSVGYHISAHNVSECIRMYERLYSKS